MSWLASLCFPKHGTAQHQHVFSCPLVSYRLCPKLNLLILCQEVNKQLTRTAELKTTSDEVKAGQVVESHASWLVKPVEPTWSEMANPDAL